MAGRVGTAGEPKPKGGGQSTHDIPLQALLLENTSIDTRMHRARTRRRVLGHRGLIYPEVEIMVSRRFGGAAHRCPDSVRTARSHVPALATGLSAGSNGWSDDTGVRSDGENG